MDCLSQFKGESLVDLSVNCADIPGAETINILSTRSGGTVIFANLISNYNIALYITESISRQLDIRCADGYLEEYDEFDIQLVKELAPFFEHAVTTRERIRHEQEGKTREERLFDASGYKNSLAEDFVSESRAMSTVLSEILSVSKYDCNVLITGDTGVGKEKVANLIQKNSSRKMQPFVKINCASISPNLIESEFFGYEKGSFTGANTGGKKGYFELADNGVIFLDEVGELPLDIQAKLLRVIQDGEFFRVGGSSPVKINVRILSATNRDLEAFVEKKLFRRDLYYRLNVFPIKVPSLNERKADIPPLIHHFVRKYSEKFGIVRDIDEDAVDYLQQCDWPGNIRELENVIQRLLISCREQRITVLDVMKELHGDVMETSAFGLTEEQLSGEKALDLEQMVSNVEKNIIRYACEKYGSTRKAAKAIGISQTQLVRKKKKYEL
ncbi:MAG: sigma-54-dependent Fis family transcriptional regulator [Firmicutes bacterium]|nr:sigma-54-dependent Fis family transcriptional regulator [Bacillota bacterium]